MWPRTAVLTSIVQATGARVGDLFINTSTTNFYILDVYTYPGDVVKSTSETTGLAAGNLRGPEADTSGLICNVQQI
jgi:hypothetical protein